MEKTIELTQSFYHLRRDGEVCACGVCNRVNGDYPTKIVRQTRDAKMGRTPKILGKLRQEPEEQESSDYQPRNNGKTRIGCLFSSLRLIPAAFYYVFHTDRERGQVSDERRVE